ncbi:unnamed protein product [Coffea canephora]|uniref:Uncharacterized protein n=1 Tax=Coffea canephora TaxID=49390 RepID=A0A068VD05_COFCA|nr:unnamed protein product [Coffea canephora]
MISTNQELNFQNCWCEDGILKIKLTITFSDLPQRILQKAFMAVGPFLQ